jgi:flagellar basal-body rod protein FlgF
MNYGMYIAASGASTQMARQDVLSNNLSNVNTVGFRPDWMGVRARDVVRVEDDLAFANSNHLLERLGAGVMPSQTQVRTSQGPIQETGRPLDVAIEGEGFFVVQHGTGSDGLRVTRDGRFSIAPDGTLVLAGDGTPVQGRSGSRIRVDPTAPIDIRPDGVIEQRGVPVGRLRIATVTDAARLVKTGNSLMRAPDGQTLQLQDGGGRTVQGAVEGSGVDPIKALIGMTSASRAAQSNMQMISVIDQNMQQAIGRFGQVA